MLRSERPSTYSIAMYIRLLLARLEHLDDVGVIELLPHLLFALEALEEDDVALQLRVRDLERDLRAAVARRRP